MNRGLLAIISESRVPWLPKQISKQKLVISLPNINYRCGGKRQDVEAYVMDRKVPFLFFKKGTLHSVSIYVKNFWKVTYKQNWLFWVVVFGR